MKGFLQFLQEKSPLVPPEFDVNDGGITRPLKPLGKETKNISGSLAKLITSIFYYWDTSGKIDFLKRSIKVAISLSETDYKESRVLNILEPISRDLQFPRMVFVPPMVQEWFQQLVKTRKRLMNQLSDDDLNGAFEPNIYNLIWTITNGKGGTEWNEPTLKKGK